MDSTKKHILQTLLEIQSQILEIDDNEKLEDISFKLSSLFPFADVSASSEVQEDNIKETIADAPQEDHQNLSEETVERIQEEKSESPFEESEEDIADEAFDAKEEEYLETTEETEDVSQNFTVKSENNLEEEPNEDPNEESEKGPKEESKEELKEESNEESKEEKKVNATPKDIYKVFTINDKFLYRRELFGNSDAQYREALDLISRMDSFEEVQDYFLNDLGWNPEDENAKSFLDTIDKYFN
ncbi:MAG: hypothetical protein ACI31F_00105 [Muribaculaceae bacterium]